jgi:hypothetical protein
MVIIAIGVEYPRDMTVQRPHDRDPGQHRWTTSRHQHLIVGVENRSKQLNSAVSSYQPSPAKVGKVRIAIAIHWESVRERASVQTLLAVANRRTDK